MWRRMYLILFHAVTEALRILETGNVWNAKKVLMDAQSKAEEVYTAAEEDGEIKVINFPPNQ